MLWIQNQKTESQLSQGPLDALRQENGDPHVCQLHSKKSALWPPAWQSGWSDNTAHKLTKSKADARLCQAVRAAEKISRITTSGDVWGEGTASSRACLLVSYQCRPEQVNCPPCTWASSNVDGLAEWTMRIKLVLCPKH